MTSVRDIGGAALLGTVCGMRTFTGPAALAVRGRMGGTPARILVTAAAAGELVADKTRVIPARTAPPALTARLVSGALCGRKLAGSAGLVAGSAGAVAGAFGGYRARAALTELTGLPGPLVGAAEDGAAVAAAALATREQKDELEHEPRTKRLLYGAVRGAVAGVAGTAAMTAAQMALQKTTGASQ